MGIFFKKKEKVSLEVGLDFGTSSTKVVYSQHGKRLSKALDFGHDLPNYENFCLPSLAAIDQKGTLVLGIDAAKVLLGNEWDYGFQRLKVIVAGNHDESFHDPVSHQIFMSYRDDKGLDNAYSAEKLTAIYLAYAMNKCRELLKQLPEYKESELDIAFNICMPVDQLENNNVKTIFENIFRHAELLDREWQKKSSNFDLLKAHDNIEGSNRDFDKRVFEVPESVASMASYLVSLRKKEGLHAIIDFGSGTTDVSICNLVDHVDHIDELVSYWYSAKNIPKGTIRTERALASYLKDFQNYSILSVNDMYNHVTNLNELCNAEQHHLLKDMIIDQLSKLKNSKEYDSTWGEAYRNLKQLSLWENVEIFVCGGGSNLPFIQDIFSIPWIDEMIKTQYNISRLPEPDDYQAGSSNAPFERMTVAYGLAKSIPELGEYVLPSDAPDHTPPKLPVRTISHEDMYND